MVTININRPRQGTVYQCKNQRQAIRSSKQKLLPHQRKPCRRCCSKASCTRRLSPNRSTHRRMLTFHRNKFRVHLAICNICRYQLWNFRRRRNRKCRHNIWVNLTDRIRHRLISRHTFFYRHYSFPSFISIAPKGQTFAQIPHPLQ